MAFTDPFAKAVGAFPVRESLNSVLVYYCYCYYQVLGPGLSTLSIAHQQPWTPRVALKGSRGLVVVVEAWVMLGGLMWQEKLLQPHADPPPAV